MNGQYHATADLTQSRATGTDFMGSQVQVRHGVTGNQNLAVQSYGSTKCEDKALGCIFYEKSTFRFTDKVLTLEAKGI